MNADIITDANYPHGTPEGFKNGCRGGHCPAEVSCRTVHTRYAGDFTFRRQIDAGMTPEQIVEAERAAEAAARPIVKRNANRVYARRVPGVANNPNQQAIKDLVDQGLTDAQIADRLGKTRGQVSSTRNYLKLPANRTRRTPATAGVSSS
ncbi:hypothetical protein [Microbacterium sp. NPDC089696]|uniref:hypothetical protein n=1 Tax=Microbacterium sp. NPDC089696 TaxID=3364199 RepID=UPI00381EE03E